MKDLVGKSLAGRYDVLALIGRGGMGAVYRVLDRELDEVVALKVIRDDLADDREMIEKFRSEVRLARRVTHANVARTFELGRSENVMFCTMELVEGESLAHVLRRRLLPIEEAATIATAICDALIAAHAAGVIHRDIKPDNIMIAPGGRIVVTDFGIAAITVGDARAEGTPPYMAPEQFAGAAPAPSVDVYAVGVMLYEMVSGEQAFRGDFAAIFDAKQTLEHLTLAETHGPTELARVIARATERDVAARIPTAAVLRRELARWATASAPTRAPVVHHVSTEHASIVVLPPQGASDNAYLAQAVHAELLQRLSRTPWVRVHTSPLDGAALTIELTAGDELVVRVASSNSPPLSLRLPLVLEHVTAIAESVSAAVVAALEPHDEPPAALELLLRARHKAQTGLGRLASAVDLLEKAHALAPDSALVAATLAVAKVQRAFFFVGDGDRPAMKEAARLVRNALERAPDLFETHMAAGHLELHVGDPALAAVHFRAAIAAAPHSADAHEQLGRMLLEASHLEQGFARLADALAIAPDRRSVHWEIARARALGGDWTEHDRLVEEVTALGGESLLPRIRFITWRGVENAREIRKLELSGAFEADALALVFEVICDGAWPKHRDRLLAHALESQRPSRRRRAFVAQLVAETAALAGDAEACETLVAYAIDNGLFDLHWLDACDAIAILRSRPRFAALRERVKQRADAILDALYGDRAPVSFDETALAMPQTK